MKGYYSLHPQKKTMERRDKAVLQDEAATPTWIKYDDHTISPTKSLECFMNSVLHPFLVEIDPLTWKQKHAAKYIEALGDVNQLFMLLSLWPREGITSDEVKLLETVAFIIKALPAPNSDVLHKKAQWKELHRQLVPLYGNTAEVLNLVDSTSVIKSIRPTNWNRSLFHLANALTIVAGFHLVLTPSRAVALAGSACVLAWITEAAKQYSSSFRDRVMALMGAIARPNEYYEVNSATWFVTALLFMAVMYPLGPYSMLGVLVLGVGDPVAGLVGRKWGKHRIPGGKSFEGFAGFVISSALSCFVYQLLMYPNEPGMLAISFLAAFVGGIAELLAGSGIRDDNFLIPVAASSAAWLRDYMLTASS